LLRDDKGYHSGDSGDEHLEYIGIDHELVPVTAGQSAEGFFG
jgi:hypothetical protein